MHSTLRDGEIWHVDLRDISQDDLWISDVLENANSNFNNIFNIDSELDSFKGVQDSQYYTEEEYVNLVIDKDPHGKKLKVISLNIANLFSKLSNFKTLIQNITYKNFIPNVIIVTETHIQCNQGRKKSDLYNRLYLLSCRPKGKRWWCRYFY